MPARSVEAARPCSPRPGGSTLITSAPSHASVSVHEGPASNCVRSITRIPLRAASIPVPLPSQRAAGFPSDRTPLREGCTARAGQSDRGAVPLVAGACPAIPSTPSDVENDRLAAVRGRDRHARACPARLPRRAVEREPVGGPLDAGGLGVLVPRLPHAVLAGPLPVRLGGGVRSAGAVHARRAGPGRRAPRPGVHAGRAPRLSRARPPEVPVDDRVADG